MRRSRLVLAGIVASSCVLTLAPGGPARAAAPRRGGTSAVPVTACPPATYGGPAPTPAAPVPATRRLPGFIDRSAGVQVYGVGEPTFGGNAPEVEYALAPPRFECPATSIGADGGQYFELVDPANHDHRVVTTVSPGGAGPAELLACPYIPAVRTLVATAEGPSFDPADCTPPPGVEVRQLPTGDPDILAAAIRVPRTLREQDVADLRVTVPASDGTDTPVALFTARILDGYGVAAQDVECSLEPARRDVCVASLDFFLTTESDAGKALALPGLMRAHTALYEFLRGGPPASAEPAEPEEPPECHAAVDAKLEAEIERTAGNVKVPLPELGIELPAGLEGSLSASGTLGHVAICRSGLSARRKGFSGGDLTIDARVEHGPERGPFVYALSRAAWTSTPGAPPHQRLASLFDPQVEFEVNPHLAVNQQGEAAVELVSVELHAAQLKVTLVHDGNALLEATVGPTISLAVEISPADLEGAVEAAEAEGLDREAAIDDAAEELSGDAVVAVEEEASAYYGVDVSASMEVLYADTDSQLVTALNGDTLLATVPAEPVDPVTDPDAEVGEAAPAEEEIAAADAATDAAVIEVLPEEDILLLLLF